MSEHIEQCLLIKWASLIPELNCLFSVPNGGHRHVAVAAKLKREGVKAGVPDLMLPIARGGFNGMFIEMKAPKGRLSDVQTIWLGRLSNNGYKAVVCFGFEDAKKSIIEYLNS